ncbi:hypothetical protein PG997_007910 [Apiospora hydei]|uniref:NACHT domain-containing protein n=1 Tax=Apiospora hydei TaxID=1337664 RepID=A0ABR1WAN2_9PEZI
MATQGSRICTKAIDAVVFSILRPWPRSTPIAARQFGTTTRTLGSSQAQPGSSKSSTNGSSPKQEGKLQQEEDTSIGSHEKDEPKPANQKKTMAQLDDEMMKKMSGIAGDGGSAGVEYEDGQPVSMKRNKAAIPGGSVGEGFGQAGNRLNFYCQLFLIFGEPLLARMDAFAALGFAANICQFLEYSFKILNQVKTVRKAGALDPDLERDTRHLKEVADKLTQQPSGHGGLDEITRACTGLSKQLLDELSKIKPQSSRSKWQSFKAVVRSERRKHDISELEAKLERCRSQLNLQMTELMSRETSEKLSNITKSGHALQSDVLTLRDSLDRLRPSLEARYIGKDTSDLIVSFVTRMDEALNRVKQVSILNLVRFPGVHERFDLITDAHQRTFDWLLDDENEQPRSNRGSQEVPVNGEDDIEAKEISSASTTHPIHRVSNEALVEARKSLSSWLQSDGGAFWITGKPGAGKSTLMKYICLHENLNRYLDAWAAGSELALGKFFFWKPGTAAQKSVQGLLRGLLFSVLERSPGLISTAFPDLWNMAEASAAAMPVSLEHRDILRAFQSMLEGSLRTSKYKFVFFIDGLDEFEGRHLELLQELNSWLELYPDHVKCCVSSREYSIFRDYLSIHPVMRLHLLTERDISRSVEHRLSHIPGHLRLSSSGMKIIQETVVQKAEGVFLWVSLVLGAVEDGLFSGDSVSELVDRIQHSPTELEALFDQLLESIHPADRRFAFSALSWVLYILSHKEAAGNSAGVPLWGPAASNLNLVELSAIEATENDLWSKQFDVECDWQTFIRSSCRKVYGNCKGLLEVRGVLDARKNMLESYVALTHRSVVEFLDTVHARTLMGQYSQEFDPFQATIQEFLAFLKYKTSPTFSWKFSDTWLCSRYNDPDIGNSMMRNKMQPLLADPPVSLIK